MSVAFTKTKNCFACYTFKLSLEDSAINILSRKQNNILIEIVLNWVFIVLIAYMF